MRGKDCHRNRSRAERPIHLTRGLVIFEQTLDYAVDVLAIDTWTFQSVEHPRSFVIAGLNSRDDIEAVHDVRFEVDHGALVEPRRDQVAGVDVAARPDLYDI